MALRLSAAEPIARWVADDWPGQANHWIDRVGNKVATSHGEPVKVGGQFSGAASGAGIVFDGVDDYFEVTSDNNPIAGRKKVTIVALFKTTLGATGNDGPHWQYPGPINAESGGGPNDFGLTIGADGLAHPFFNDPIPTVPPVSVVDGLVHTMILTWSDTDDQGDGIARFYLDGVLAGVSGVQDNGSGIVNDLIRFGRERETGDRWFRGTIGELRFYETIEDPAAVHGSMAGNPLIPVTLTGPLIYDKVYDGASIATMNPAAASLSGITPGDFVGLDVSAATASFGSPSVGTGKAVTVSGLALTGPDAWKYVLAEPISLKADITPKPVTITGISASSRTFDATRTAALVVSNPQLIGILDGDVVTLNSSQATALFDTSAVGPNKLVTVAGLALEGKDAGNYQCVSPSITASINSDGLTAGSLVAVSEASFNIGPNGEVEFLQTSQLPAGALVERVVLSLEYSTYWTWDAIAGNYVKLNGLDLPGLGWTSIGTGNAWQGMQTVRVDALGEFNRSGENRWRIGSAWNLVSLRNVTLTMHYWVPTLANREPTEIALSATTVAENNAANATVGTLTATDPVTVTVTDGGGLSATQSFVLTVTAVNDAPTIATISNQLTPEDVATGAIAFTVGDVDTVLGSLTVTATSSNPGVVAADGIVLGGSGADRTITLSPVANASGTSTITVTVTDGGGLTAARSFVLTVAAAVELLVNPQFALLDPVNPLKPLAWDSTEGWVVFSGSGGNDAPPSVHPAGLLAFGRSSSVVVSQTVPVFPMTSSGVASFMLEYDVAKNQREGVYWVQAEFLSASGTVLATLRRPSSGTEAAPSAWATNQLVLNRESLANFDQITQVRVSLFGQQSPYVWSGHYGPFFNHVSLTAVLLPNTAPTIGAISDQTTLEDTATGAIPFTVGDVETEMGSPTVTVTVTDGGGLSATQSFVLTVTAVNDAPTIATISNQLTLEDVATGAIAFTVGDVETAVGSLTVTASSSDLGVVAAEGIALGGSGANRTITLSPVANASGTSTITVKVTDGGGLSATQSFVLTVTAVNDVPTIGAISDQTTLEDMATGAIPFTVDDFETAAGSLTATATSSNVRVVAAGGISLGGSGADRTITLTPVANASGTSTITVTVTDAGGLSATRSFALVVTPVPDVPTGEGFLLGAGLMPVVDAAGRYRLEASLGQVIAGSLPIVSGVELASGFWVFDLLADALGSPMGGVPTPAQAAKGLMLREVTVAGTEAGHRSFNASARMASGVRLPDARMRVASVGEGAKVRIAVSGLPRARWHVQSAEGFGTGSWRHEGILQLDAEGEGVLETSGGDESAVRFYRLVQP
ncbi:MAG: YDG domain-containing protein [Verrucomicrobium sp.]|nr:YDG domain-containing protein [Verrucomicrobium sp.]